MSNGGPWGGGGGGGDDRDDDREDKRPGQRRPGEGGQIPEIEEFMRKGSEQLKVLMGGKGAAIVPTVPMAAEAAARAPSRPRPRSSSALWPWLRSGSAPRSTR